MMPHAQLAIFCTQTWTVLTALATSASVASCYE